MLRIAPAPLPVAVVPIVAAAEPVIPPEPAIAIVDIDTSVVDLMSLAGQDEEWD